MNTAHAYSYFPNMEDSSHLLDDELVGHYRDVIIRNSLRCPDGALRGLERDKRKVRDRKGKG